MTPRCPACENALPPDSLGREAGVTCHACHAPLEVEVYPALGRPLGAGIEPARASSEGDSTCFYHEGYRAAVPCDACGRFLCGLCDLLIGDRHLCPECLHRSVQTRAPQMTNERFLWDRFALSLAILPVLTIYLPLLTAPAAIGISLRHWRTPGSLVSHGRWRFIVALVLATLELGGWGAMIYFFARGIQAASTPG